MGTNENRRESYHCELVHCIDGIWLFPVTIPTDAIVLAFFMQSHRLSPTVSTLIYFKLEVVDLGFIRDKKWKHKIASIIVKIIQILVRNSFSRLFSNNI